jgi:hypothetical protein
MTCSFCFATRVEVQEIYENQNEGLMADRGLRHEHFMSSCAERDRCFGFALTVDLARLASSVARWLGPNGRPVGVQSHSVGYESAKLAEGALRVSGHASEVERVMLL